MAGKYISKGIHSNVSKNHLNVAKKLGNSWDSFMNKFNAYLNGKDPWITIDNPNKLETNKRMIRVKASTIYGSLKDRKQFIIKGE